MPLLPRIRHFLRNLSQKKAVDRDLSDEVGSYVELLTQKNRSRGMNEEEARRAALLQSGGVEQLKEQVRNERAGFSLDTLFQDIRYGLRSLRKKPGFTLTAVVALGLGIGANTAIFSVINAVLLRSLDYPNPDRIVMLWEKNAARNSLRNFVSPANFQNWQKQSTSFEQIAAAWDSRATISGEGAEPEDVQAQRVTWTFFPALGVQPLIGRGFAADEDRPGGDLVIVLSHQLWRSRFGGNPAIVGQQATVSGRLYTVIGVMPAGFHFLNAEVQAWLPLAIDPVIDYRKSGRFLRTFGRLKSGVTIQQAQAEMSGIAGQLAQEFPEYNRGWDVNVLPIHEQVVGDIRPVLLVLVAAVAFVLLIACANVANLLLARAAARHKELALRAALGASRFRLVRQMLTESVLLSLIGGVFGVFLAYWGVRIVVAFGPNNIPRLREVGIDPRVLAFTFGVSIITGILFGLLPALQASRPGLNDALKEGARGSTGRRARVFRNVFVVAEVSLALVLLIGASLMMRSFFHLHQVKPGFISENVLTMRVQLPMAKYPEAPQRANFFKEARDRIATLPGVQSVGAINFLPLNGPASNTIFNIDGRPELPNEQAPGTEVRVVTPNYFNAMGIPLIRGRAFDERDDADSRVLVINDTLARRFFPNEDPIGKRLTISWNPKVSDEIIGVVGDIRESALEAEAHAAIYWPHPREAYQFMNLIVRTAGDPRQIASAAQKEIRAIDPDQPVADVWTMSEVVSRSMARPRFNTLLLATFAGIALILASVGIYGVMNYSATQRTQEIGIRMALGAKPFDILRLVVGHGMKLTGAGVLLGVIASLALTRVMSNLLFGITATDLSTFFGVSAALTLVALVANYIPARRATRVNPVVALRYE